MQRTNRHPFFAVDLLHLILQSSALICSGHFC